MSSQELLLKINYKKTIVLLIMLGLITGIVFILYGYFNKNEAILAEEQQSLTATGTIEARSVMAAFKIPGRIGNILVDEGSKVTRGQELAWLDSREVEAKLIQAQGAHSAAQAQAAQAGSAIPLTMDTVEANISYAQTAVEKAQIQLTATEQKYDRYKVLYENDAISGDQFDGVEAAYQAAQQDLQAAQSKLNEALAARLQVDVVQSKFDAAAGQSMQAEGAVQEAQAYVDNAQLVSPIDGFITGKFLDTGEMLNAGTPVFEISDLLHTYVKVFIDETKIGRVKLNQPAEITVDAYPDKVFKGKVVWINDAGQFAVHKAINEQYSHDIRSFEVKIDVPNQDMQLKTGMTAVVKIVDGE